LKTIATIFLLIISATCFSQTDFIKLKEQADETAKATVDGNYENIIQYTHPNLLKMMGGREALLNILETAMEEVKKQGITIESVKLGEPGASVQAGEEIHCLLPQTVIMKYGDKRMKSEGHLLCISQDKGLNWFFLDMSGVDMSNIKSILPNYNFDLKLPEKKAPEFID
jgi:hypothetical protein